MLHLLLTFGLLELRTATSLGLFMLLTKIGDYITGHLMSNSSQAYAQVKQKLDSFLEELNLPADLPMYCVNDQARNMKLAVKLSKHLDQYLCNNHILQCAVRDSFVMTAGMDDALQTCKDLAFLTHQSTVAAELLELESDAQGINFRQLRQSVDTRWNSELDCMASVLHLKSAIISFCANEDIFSSKTISASQWKSIEGAVEILAPLKEATETWSAESIPTINTVADSL